MNLDSKAAQQHVNQVGLDTKSVRYDFPMPPLFTCVEPKYKSACVYIRSLLAIDETDVHSTYTEPEPLMTSIRDHTTHDGPARYKQSTAVTLGATAGEGAWKWSAVGQSFQINLENHPDGVADATAHPAQGTVGWWNGDRWTSTAAVYPGLPADVQAAVIHPEYPHKVLFFKGDSMYIYNLDTTALESTESVATRFPQFTGTIAYAYRSSSKGNNPAGEMQFWHLNLYNTDGDLFRWEYAHPSSGAWDFMLTSAAHHGTDWTAWSESWNMIFRETNGVSEVEGNPNTGLYVAYGAGTSVYPTLPTGIQAAFFDKVNSKSYAIKGSTLYELNPTSKTVIATSPIGAAVVTANHMDDGNWTDGSDYTLKIDPTATTMDVYTYGTVDPVATSGVHWTITAWGHTPFYGTVEYDSKKDVTRLLNHQSTDGLPVYRPFVQGSFTAANVGEQFTGDQHTEVIAYDFPGKLADLTPGTKLTPELLQNKKPTFAAADNAALNTTLLRSAIPSHAITDVKASTALGTAAGFFRVFLNGVSQPNSIDIGANETTDWASNTRCIATIPLDRNVFGGGTIVGSAYLAEGDCCTHGVYVGSTVINEPLSITIEAWPGGTDMTDLARWQMTLDVQLISNEEADRV
jgi:hypothetical protein